MTAASRSCRGSGFAACRLRAATALLSVVSMAAAPLAAAAAPASAPSAAQIQAQYEQQRARCLNGTSNQDKATCLKEAGAAREEAKKSHLDDTGASYQADAAARCNALTGDDARDCRARVKGKGTTASTGSVQSGGVFHETRTTVNRPEGAASGTSAP